MNASKKYDLIVVGSGSAGLSVSLVMAKIGLDILLIEQSEKHIGGDCLNDGCIPSKALIHLSRIAYQATQAARIGFTVTGVADQQKIRDYIRSKQEIIRRQEDAAYLKKQGMDVVIGKAAFHGSDSVVVGSDIYSAKRIVLATGSKPVMLRVPGLERIPVFTNESIFDIGHLPARLLVLGGGPIAVEIAQAFRRFGTAVTMVNKGARLLEHDPPDIARVLEAQLIAEGIEIFHQSAVEEVIDQTTISIIDGQGGKQALTTDALFVAIGRELSFSGLSLEKAGIEIRDGKLVLTRQLRTTNPTVYACGDVAGSLQFSHAAEQQARLLLNNFFSPLKKRLNNDKMSWVTFTDPEVASFGLHEKQLTERKISFEKLSLDFEGDDRAVTDEQQGGRLVLFISKKHLFQKQRILGGSMVCRQAGEMIQELLLAAVAEISINAIFNKIYPYPVASRVNQAIISKYKQRALNGFLIKVLNRIYRFS